MATKRKIALLTLPGFDTIAMPVERHTWSKHPIVQYTFSKRANKDSMGAQPPLEFVDFKSTESETPLSHYVYQTLFRDNKDGEGSR